MTERHLGRIRWPAWTMVLIESGREGRTCASSSFGTGTFVTCIRDAWPAQNSFLALPIATRSRRVSNMIDITPIELRVALAVLAIAVLVIVAKMSRAKPKRAEKWEKAAIMKQLLALSEQEE